jgi:7-cyano-7-deazaguanine synthase
LKEKSSSIDNFSEAVCIFSGGLDSISTAAYLKKMGLELYLISLIMGNVHPMNCLLQSAFQNY